MLLRVGCAFEYRADAPSPAVLFVDPRQDIPGQTLRRMTWESDPPTPAETYLDAFGNRCRRVLLPAGVSRLRYDAIVEVDGQPDAVEPNARQQLVEELPHEVLPFTLASRYCWPDVLSSMAWTTFGETPPGWARVQAVCDWINANITYGGASTPLTTAVDVYEARSGVCRDFAHLGITLCRAMSIPARYVFGYMPDIGVPPPHPPMDFHAWFEAYLAGRWWTFDARFNTPRIGRIPVGYGRDAVDVAMATTWGPVQFVTMEVWADAIADVR